MFTYRYIKPNFHWKGSSVWEGSARARERSQNWSHLGARARTPFTWRTPFKGNLIINTHTYIQYSTVHYITLQYITLHYIHTYTYIRLNMYIYNYIHTDMTDVCGASSSSVCSSRSLRAATCSSGSWTSCTCCMHRQGGWTKRNAYKTSSKSRQGFKCFSTISVLVKLWTFV